MNVLVVAAWEPELERFRALGPVETVNLSIGAVGVGLVDAAAGMTRCIAQHRPDHVLLVGTCGAVPGSGLAIGDVVTASEVSLADPATVEARAALPYAAGPVALEGALAVVARSARVYCSLGITTDDALARALAPLGDAEHLEAFAVARACALTRVPCTIVLAVANVVGARGRDEWRAHHVEASARAAEVAHEAIRAYATGSVRTSTTARSPA